MASMGLSATLSKLHATTRSNLIIRSPLSSRVFYTTSPTNFQVRSRRYCTMSTLDEAGKQGRDAAKKAADAAKKGGQQVKNDAAAAADTAAQKTKDMAGKVSETAQDTAGKVKQTAQEAWGSVKDTTQKIKDTVVRKAEAAAESTKDTVKEEAARVERNMNSKN